MLWDRKTSKQRGTVQFINLTEQGFVRHPWFSNPQNSGCNAGACHKHMVRRANFVRSRAGHACPGGVRARNSAAWGKISNSYDGNQLEAHVERMAF